MRKEIKGLTGIRGLAASYVALYHFHFADSLTAEAWSPLVNHGYIAVDLFFVLSGFVMALTYGERFVAGYDMASHRNFMWRRFARIYPVYLLISLFVVAISLIGVSTQTPPSVFEALCNLLLVQTWGLSRSMVGPAWSISVEWAVYFAFPMITAVFLGGRAWRSVVGAALCICVLYGLANSDAPIVVGSQSSRHGPLDLFSSDSIGAILRCVTGFCLGVFAFRFREGEFVRMIGSSAICQVILAVLLAVLLFLRETDLVLIMCFPLLVLVLYRNEGLLPSIVGSKPIYWLGVWSYSLYLIHTKFEKVDHFVYLKLRGAGLQHPEVLASAMTLLAAIAMSACLYRWVELPCRDRLQRLAGSRQRSPHGGSLGRAAT